MTVDTKRGRGRSQPAKAPPPANQTTALERTPTPEQQAITRVEGFLASKRDQLLSLYAGDERMADRMATVTLHALAHPRLMQKLLQADMATVLLAIRDCASLGLMPISSTAEGALVPYWNKSKGLYDFQFQPMYRGLEKLVYRGDRVLGLQAEVVYAGDTFDYREGTNRFLDFKKALVDRGDRVGAFALAHMRNPDGPPVLLFEVLSLADIEKARMNSKAADDGPWVDHYDPMAQKTALRRLMNDLPLTDLAELALRLENETESRYDRAPTVSVSRPSPASFPGREQIYAELDLPTPPAPEGAAAAEAPAPQQGEGGSPGQVAAPADGDAGAAPAPTEGAADPARPFSPDEVDEIVAQGQPTVWPEKQ